MPGQATTTEVVAASALPRTEAEEEEEEAVEATEAEEVGKVSVVEVEEVVAADTAVDAEAEAATEALMQTLAKVMEAGAWSIKTCARPPEGMRRQSLFQLGLYDEGMNIRRVWGYDHRLMTMEIINEEYLTQAVDELITTLTASLSSSSSDCFNHIRRPVTEACRPKFTIANAEQDISLLNFGD